MDNIGGPSRPTPQHQPLFWVQQSPTGEWTFGSPEHYQTQPMQIWHDPTNGSNQFPFAGSPQSVTYQTITSPGQSQAIRYYNQTDTNQWINTNKENKTVKVKNKRETIKEHIQLSVQNRFEVLSDEAANESDNESYMGEAVSCREAEGMPSISNDINNERRREENPRILTPTVTNTLAIPKGHEKVNLENKAKNRKPFPMTVITNASIEYNCSVNIILTEHNKQFPDHSTIIKNLKNILKENKFEYDLVKNNELLIVHSQNENSKELLLKTTKLGSLSVMVELRKKLVRGVIKGVNLKMTEADIKECLDTELKIHQIKRLKLFNKETRKTEDSKAVLITFVSDTLPSHIWFAGRPKEVAQYNRPIIQCHNCQKFGHIKTVCRSPKPSCLRCGKSHQSKDCPLKTEPVETRNTKYHCVNCNGNHTTTSATCPQRRQNKIITKIAETQNIGIKRAESAYKSYAQVANKQLSKTSQFYLNKEEFPPISRDQELEIQSDVQTVVKKIIKEIARNPRIFDTSSIPVEEKINSLCKVIEQITNIKISPREINEPELDRAFKVRNESTLNQLIC